MSEQQPELNCRAEGSVLPGGSSAVTFTALLLNCMCELWLG